MDTVTLKAYGKVNLSLDVLNRRSDGYHNIDTIMQEISLFDTLEIERVKGMGCHLSLDDVNLPTDGTNLCVKAWQALKPYYDGDPGVRIHLTKRIPIAAGLAGGSTDCAATMSGLNTLWNLNLTPSELMVIGASLGADVPFFFVGGTQRATGIGEVLAPVALTKPLNLLIVNNGKPISTPYVYGNLPAQETPIPMDAIVKALESDDPIFYTLAQNRMEPVGVDLYPEIANIIDEMKGFGARMAMMSGSGPTVYGVYEDIEAREAARAHFSKRYDLVFTATTRS